MFQNLERDIKYLGRDEWPIEPSGLKVDKLDYEGESSGDEGPVRLNDENV